LSSPFRICLNLSEISAIVWEMAKAVLYLGDTELTSAASYLAGVMHSVGIDFDYLASDENFSDTLIGPDSKAVIISDYPAGNFTLAQLESLADKVESGLGLLMIGGWESFTGAACEYTNTPLKDVLPIVMQSDDDRINCCQPCMIEKLTNHKIIDALPFDKCPPLIGGYNRLTCKQNSDLILALRKFNVTHAGEEFEFVPDKTHDPLLVTGLHGKGRVCAFASDVAPHWVGGLVDWGDARLETHAPGANAIEVGNWYAQLFANMVKWTMGSV